MSKLALAVATTANSSSITFVNWFPELPVCFVAKQCHIFVPAFGAYI